MRYRRLIIIFATVLVVSVPAPIGRADPHGDSFIYLPLVMTNRQNPLHIGIATYYYADGSGACGFDPSPNDLMVAALNAEEYDNAAYCGAYVQVTGRKGTITVRIVDLCPECLAGHLDLSLQAFALIDDVPLPMAESHHFL